VPIHPLALTREQILGFRRRSAGLDERRQPGPETLRGAAWAGLQDSAPRSALLSLHARVTEVVSDAWADPSLVQLWGPRYVVYVVAERDRAVFTLGRMPDSAARRSEAEQLAERIERFLDGRTMTYEAVGREFGIHPNGLRYAAPTGRVVMRWDGAERPAIWTVPAPTMDVTEARRELARRHLHAVGPATPESFAEWAGVAARHARTTFAMLERPDPQWTLLDPQRGRGCVPSPRPGAGACACPAAAER